MLDMLSKFGIIFLNFIELIVNLKKIINNLVDSEIITSIIKVTSCFLEYNHNV